MHGDAKALAADGGSIARRAAGDYGVSAMRGVARLAWRAVYVVAAVALLLGLTTQAVGAASAGRGSAGRRGEGKAADRSRPATLAARRADVWRALAAADGSARLAMEHARATTRSLSRAQQRQFRGIASRLATGLAVDGAEAASLPDLGARKARSADGMAATGPEPEPGAMLASGPAGPINWDYRLRREPTLTGYPSHGSNYADDSAFPGEVITATVAMYNTSTTSKRMDVSWSVSCNGIYTNYNLRQVVTAPPAPGGNAGGVQGGLASFTYKVPSPGSKGCTGVSVAGAAGQNLWIFAWGTLVGGSSTYGEGFVDYDVKVGAGQFAGCPASPDAAWEYEAQYVCEDPVDSASGTFSGTFTDASLQSPGYPLAITRSYSSAVNASESMGPGWSLPWQASLSVKSSGTVVFTDENGDTFDYVSSKGAFVAPPGPRSVLAAVRSGKTVTGYTLTTPDNDVLTFSPAGGLKSIKDATGRGITLGYSGSLVTSLTDAAGQKASLSYASGHLTKITLPDKAAITYGYTEGRLTSVTTPGDGSRQTSTYAYTAQGLLASIKDADGNYQVRNTYDSAGQVTRQEDGTGAVTTFSYTKTSGGLDETDVTYPDGGITTDVYGGGMLLKSIDPLGGTTSYVYNRFFEPTVITDPLGHVTTSIYDASGNLTSQVDPLGDAQDWTYDSHNNLTQYLDADLKSTAYTYNPMDEPTSVTVPGGGKTTFAYDSAGSLISSVDPRGNAPGGDPARYRTTYTYNRSGELASVTSPDGDTTATTYDAMGYPLTVTDPLGHVTRYGYDSADQLTSVTAPGGGVTRYAYDGDGNLISLTDPGGSTWTYAYDADNRLSAVTSPLGQVTRYSYDGDGNQATETDARGIVTTTSYNADDRPVEISYSDGTPSVSYSYDADGDVTSITDATGRRTLAYDADGDLVRATGPSSGSFTYAYDPAGNIISRTYPDGTTVSYGYNSAEEITSMIEGSAKTTYAYDPAGNLVSTTEPDGVTETRHYDDAAQLTSITDQRGATTLDAYGLTLNADGQPVKALTSQDGATQPPWYYTYDTAGQLASACQTTAAPSSCSAARGGGETAWTYDPAGNMLTQVAGGTTTSYSYNADSELTKATTPTTTVSYGYNADGDLTSAGADSYAYNGAGELASATTTAGTYTYTYDDAGNLSAVSDNGNLKQTITWDLNNPLPLAVEQSSPGGGTENLVYNPNATLNAISTTAGTSYAITDWLGSVTGLVSSSGAQVSSTTYTPYGTPATTGAPASPIGYADSYTLPGSGGLDDMHARDYDPATATFATVDPLLITSAEPYTYVADDPVADTDATGMISCPSWLPGCGLITGIQNYISSIARAWWKQWWTDNPCNNPAAAEAVPLQLLHPEGSMLQSSLDYWGKQSTQAIVDSLAPGSASPLVVKADGTIMNGNTRIWILMQRGYDVDSLARVPYESPSLSFEEFPDF
jgi:RHS repeat-associated protein